MKNIYLYLVITAAAIGAFSSCSFLEVETRGRSDTDSFFSETDGLYTAETGLYNATFDFYNLYFAKYPEVAGDVLQMTTVGSDGDFYYQYNFLSTPDLETTAVGYLWKKGYVITTNANTILYYIDDLKSNYPEEIDRIRTVEAEAYFLRGMAHFDLVRCYAQPYGYTSDASHIGVALADHLVGTSERIARSTVKAVYNSAIKDIKAAQNILGNDAPTDAHYLSGMACNALLCRIYLYMGDYANAEAYADLVIPELSLTSYDDYEDMFTGEETGDEAIFRLTSYYAGSSLRSFYNYESSTYYPISDFVDEFDTDDVRRKLLIGPDDSYACMKYYDLTGASSDDRFYNITVLRLSEMYLNRAEARCMQGDLSGAASDLRAIRARALNLDESAISPSDAQATSMGANALMEEIKQERKKELFAEGHRFFDLARWGDNIVRYESTNSSVQTLSYPDYRFALPIPQVEMDANEAMVQNEGY